MFGTVRKHSQPLWIVIIIMVVIEVVFYVGINICIIITEYSEFLTRNLVG